MCECVCVGMCAWQRRWAARRQLLRLWAAIGQVGRAERVKSPWHGVEAGSRSKAQAVAALLYDRRLSRAVGRRLVSIWGGEVVSYM